MDPHFNLPFIAFSTEGDHLFNLRDTFVVFLCRGVSQTSAQLCRELVSINKGGNADRGNRAYRSSVSLARMGYPLSSTEQVPEIGHLNFSVIQCRWRALTGGFPGIPVAKAATYTTGSTGGNWGCSEMNREGAETCLLQLLESSSWRLVRDLLETRAGLFLLKVSVAPTGSTLLCTNN